MQHTPIATGDCRTQGGRRAVVLCNDAPGMWPVIGYVVGDGVSHPRGWHEDGRAFSSVEHVDDLIVRKPSPTVTIIEDDEVAE